LVITRQLVLMAYQKRPSLSFGDIQHYRLQTPEITRFPVKSYPSQLVLCQLVLKSSRTQYQLVPKSSRTHSISYPSQLVPNTISYPKHNLRRQNPSVRDLLSPSMKKRLDPRQCHTANVSVEVDRREYRGRYCRTRRNSGLKVQAM